MTEDIKGFYYGTPLQQYEYVCMALADIPDKIFQQYNIRDLATNGWVYIEMCKGMPGLKQAGKITNNWLITHLSKYSYSIYARTLALWRHTTRPVTFTLFVDDFVIKYKVQQHVEHLLDALQDMYMIMVDWKGTLCLGLTIQWNYTNGQVTISMPGYIAALLLRFQHPMPS